MAEVRINATGGLKLYDADDSHYAQILAGTITSNTDVMTLGHAAVVMGTALDINGNELILDADADTSITADSDDQIDVKIANSDHLILKGSSGDVIFQTATDAKDIKFNQYDGRTLLDVNDGGFIGLANGATGPGELRIYEDTDLGSHYTGFKAGNATASVSYVLPVADGSNGNALLTDGSGTLSWGSGGTTYAGIDDQSSSNDDQLTIADGVVTINEDSDDVDFRVESNGNTHMFFVDGGNDVIGINEDTVEGHLSFNTAGADGNHMCFKNSDVAHGVTDYAETDTYAVIRKRSSTGGGLNIRGMTELTYQAMHFEGIITGTMDTTHGTGGNCAYEFRCFAADGSSAGTSLTANGNIFGVYSGNSCRFIIDQEGDAHFDGGRSTYDEYDDAQLARAYDLSHGNGTINSKFDKFIAYNHEKLAELKLVGREKDGTPNNFVNLMGFQRLHNGAIWQQYEKHQQLLEAVYDLAKESVGEEKADAILAKHEVKRLQ